MIEQRDITVCVQRQQDGDVRWLAMLLRRIGMLIVHEVERRYDIEPSLMSKNERERRAQERR